MLLLRLIRRPEGRIRIETDVGKDLSSKGEVLQGRGPAADPFLKTAYDALIENGVYVPESNSEELRRAAFQKLGLIDERELSRIDEYLAQMPVAELSVFAADHKTLLRRLLTFSRKSGILLPYLITYRLGRVVSG